MSSFSVDGLVSGLDTTTLVNQLMQIERIPQQRLQLNLKTQNSTVAAYQSVATRLQAAETAIGSLTKDSAWGARVVTVTGTSVTATAAPGATTGRAELTVNSLATAATFTSTQGYALTDSVAANGADITVTTAAGATVVVKPKSGSLTDVMAAINGAPETGLSAIAVKVGTDSYRLQLRAKETGTDAAPVSVTGITAPLAAEVATNATYSVNGTSITGTSQSNTVTDLLPGLSVTFTGLGTSTVDVGANSAATADAVQAMVDAVNRVLDEVATQTIKDAASTTRGPLASDSQIRAMSTNLLRAVSDVLGDNQSAAQAGLETTRDGRLTFDREAFTAAYARNPGGVRALLSPLPEPAPGPGDPPRPPGYEPPQGVAQRLSEIIARATNKADGSITLAVQGRETTAKDLQTQIDSWDRRLELRRANLNRQFSGLEVALQRLQSQGSFLGGVLNNLSANNR